jgi:hypothetical protein
LNIMFTWLQRTWQTPMNQNMHLIWMRHVLEWVVTFKHMTRNYVEIIMFTVMCFDLKWLQYLWVLCEDNKFLSNSGIPLRSWSRFELKDMQNYIWPFKVIQRAYISSYEDLYLLEYISV